MTAVNYLHRVAANQNKEVHDRPPKQQEGNYIGTVNPIYQRTETNL